MNKTYGAPALLYISLLFVFLITKPSLLQKILKLHKNKRSIKNTNFVSGYIIFIQIIRSGRKYTKILIAIVSWLLVLWMMVFILHILLYLKFFSNGQALLL